VVDNVDGYCGRSRLRATDKFCFTRQEGDPQATACDYMAVGRAGDTARYGPTWFYNGRPCTAQPGENGCSNHPDNQFLVLTRGDGEYAACAARDIPCSTNPDRPGNRAASARSRASRSASNRVSRGARSPFRTSFRPAGAAFTPRRPGDA
jgi:hypothetical protein